MAYQKHNWVSREVIKREYLQNIEDGIYNEEQRAIGAENTLTTNLANEVSRAINKENQLSQSMQDFNTAIYNETTRATAKEGEIEAAVSAEETRALAAESTLAGNISDVNTAVSTERTRAVGAENTLTTNLAAEVTRATGAEQSLATDIASEASRAVSAEQALSTSVSAETTRAQNAEQTLSNGIASETSRATQAESDLHDYVDQKVSRTYKASGSVYFADLPVFSPARRGNVYNIKDDFTTTAAFFEGAGKNYPAGTNVAIIGIDGDYYDEVTPIGTENPSEEGWYEYDSVNDEYSLSADTTVDGSKTYYVYTNVEYWYDAMTGLVDLSDYVEKTDYATTQSAGVVKPDGTTVTVDADGTLHSSGGGGNTSNFLGTRAEWEQLTIAQKDEYDTTDFPEEVGGATITDTVSQGSTDVITSGGVWTYVNQMITQALAASY